MEEVGASALVSSLSSLLGPPRYRGSKFVGENRNGTETFEWTKDASKVLQSSTPEGLASTVLGCITKELARESCNCGVTWAVALALSLHAKLQRNVLREEVLQQFSMHEIKTAVLAMGEACIAAAQGCRRGAGDVERFQTIWAGAKTREEGVFVDDEEVSWFFDDEASGGGPSREAEGGDLERLGEVLTKICKSLYEGHEDEGSGPGVVERLSQECLLVLLLGGPSMGRVGMDHLTASAGLRLKGEWANQHLEVVQVTGPEEGCSFAMPGFLLHVSKWSEMASVSTCLPVHDLVCDPRGSQKYQKVAAVVMAGSLLPVALEMAVLRNNRENEEVEPLGGDSNWTAKDLLRQKEEAFAAFKDYCKRCLKAKWNVSLLLIEGSVDSRIQTELSSQGLLVISGLGSQTIYRLGKHTKTFVAADLFAVRGENVSHVEAGLMKCHGAISPHCSTSYAGASEKGQHRLMANDEFFLALRTEVPGTESFGDDSTLTLFVTSMLSDTCEAVASEVKKLVSKAMHCLVHGFLPGAGALERTIISELRGRRRARSERARILEPLVIASFIQSFEELLHLSSPDRHVVGPANQQAPGFLHFDGYHERICGMRRVLEILAALLSTGMTLTNKVLP